MCFKFLKNLFATVLFLICLPSLAQKIDEDRLLKHLEYLSSDQLAGRATLSEGSQKAKIYILENLTTLELVEPLYPDFIQYFSFENTRRKQVYEDAANIVALIPGSETNKVIVITAHYDHVGVGRVNAEGDSIYNGADDNASGTSALLVLADYFSKNRPKHSIVFAALDAEELGLRGARALLEDFPYPMEQIVLNVNMDMISRNDQNEIFASGTHYNPYLKDILEKAAANSSPTLKFGHDIPGTGREDWTKSSDHGAFYEKKVPHIYFGVEDHQDYHKPSDEFGNIQQEFFINSANLILKCILALDQELLQSEKK
ncbi:M28 family peptidase [Algoriphagus mannitolivorans]|uniref:M28 family peptidase n=1 Tax=Algoriphagus mannitolivorans TaxID=226504 RepID=UPI00041CF0B2|nr:M28 family peptidase [Algoriphagus mannitolivorans]